MADSSPEKQLTLKQAKWLDLYFDKDNLDTFGNATECAMRVYDCKDRWSASNIGGENVKKLGVGALMDHMGLSDTRLISKLDELVDAKRTVSAISGKDANAGTVDFIDVPDYQTQVKALDIALKLKKKYDPPVQVNVQNNTVGSIEFVMDDAS